MSTSSETGSSDTSVVKAPADTSVVKSLVPRRRRSIGRRIANFALLLFGPLLVCVAGLYIYMDSVRYVTTENAYVKADKIAISTDVSGRVAEVLVVENDTVVKGQVLFRIDDKPFRIALARSMAELGMVENEVTSFRAEHRQQLAELRLAMENLAFSKREFERQQRLSRKGLVAEAAHDGSRHQMHIAERRIAAIREDIARALTKLGGDPDLATEDHPRYARAIAARDDALLNVERTVVRAPEDGVVSSIALQAGEYVEEGEPIFTVVAIGSLWITANLKETKLTHVREGQTVELQADAYPDHRWKASVESIGSATGAEFALLPPQNASGNWVKVVQRVPVRLVLEQQDEGPPLRVGMSVEAKIDTGREPQLPESIELAFGWLRALSGAPVSAANGSAQ